MMPTARSKHAQNGFTLLETVITLILISIMGAMFIQFMGPQLTQSPFQILRVDDQYVLIEEIERLTGLYRDQLRSGALDINTFKANQVDTNAHNNGSQIITLTTAGGYTTQYATILQVRLSKGEHRISTLFTQYSP